MIYNFTVEGTPKAEPRPRFARKGKFAFAYEPKEIKVVKQLTRLRAREAQIKIASKGIPVTVELEFYFQRPASHFNKSGRKSSSPENHTQKPDIDNLVKTYTDALLEIAYEDDSQVIKVIASKYWLENHKDESFTKITIHWNE